MIWHSLPFKLLPLFWQIKPQISKIYLQTTFATPGQFWSVHGRNGYLAWLCYFEEKELIGLSVLLRRDRATKPTFPCEARFLRSERKLQIKHTGMPYKTMLRIWIKPVFIHIIEVFWKQNRTERHIACLYTLLVQPIAYIWLPLLFCLHGNKWC